MPKIKVNEVKLVRANDKSMGEISFEFNLPETRIRVQFKFPDNYDLFSPNGSYFLTIWRWRGGKMEEAPELDCEADEPIREAFGGEFDDLSLRRLRDVARAVNKAMR
jgi:hypothetical protein